MESGLKIYACSGVGTGVGNTEYKFTYWMDNTDAITNTKAVNNMLAFVNSVNADIIYGELSEEELINDCNVIDLYIVCLQAAKTYHGAELERAGRVIGVMVKEGFFNSQSLDDKERDENLDALIAQFTKTMNSTDDYELNTPFYDWFIANVAEYDYVGLTPEQQAAARKYQQGVGATDESSAIDKFVNSGAYYIYLYFDEEERKKLPYWITKKIKKQAEVKEYVYGYYGSLESTEALDANIRTGICKDYKHTPEWVINEIKTTTGWFGETTKGTGEVVAASIITAIATLLATVISAIALVLNFVVSIVQAKYSVPTDAESGAATGEDIDAMMQEAGATNSSKTKYIKWGLLGALALLIFNKK